MEDLQQVLSEEGVIDARNKWNVDKRSLIKKDGLLSVDDVMSEMGFSDMNDFLVWILEGMTEKDFRENVINDRLQEWEASYSPEAEYVGSVASDIALQKRDELLSGQEQISTQDLIFTSDKRASGMPLTRLDGEYEALLAKEQKEAARALSVSLDQRQQKTKDKLTAKVEETIGAERLRRARLGAAYRARIEREDIKRKVRRIANSTTINADFRQQILQLMAMYKGLGRKSQVPQRVFCVSKGVFGAPIAVPC